MGVSTPATLFSKLIPRVHRPSLKLHVSLSENSVALNPLDDHHFPYENSYLGVFSVFSDTPM
jgi:hypothetical protein